MEKIINTEQIEHNEYNQKLTRGRLIALLLAPIIAGIVYYMALPQGGQIAGALSITVFVAILWVSEALPLPVTALLIPIGLAGIGVFELREAFSPFGSSVLFLVLGGYALAVAVEKNGVDKWIAQHILGLSGNKTVGLFVAIMATSALLSMLISNTATTALLLNSHNLHPFNKSV